MKLKTLFWYSLLVSLILYTLVSWPLPRYLTRGIPANIHTGSPVVQYNIPGDHLQLLYHFWLAGDMIAGHTPAFYNIYEFNTGDKNDRFMPGSYYFPFSIVHSLLASLSCPAFGWNVTSFLAVWLTLLATWALALRFTARVWLAGAAAVVGVLLPFRWINLFGGSPAGFTMMWPPVIWLGIDMAVRDRRDAGGALAGFGVLMAAWADLHVYFFSVLAIPLWGVMALLADRDFRWRSLRDYLLIVRALVPFVMFTVLALIFPAFLKWVTVHVTGAPPAATLISQRTLREVLLYSPHWRGVFDWFSSGLSEHVFLGFAVPGVLLLGGLALVLRPLRQWREDWRSLALWLILCAGILLAISLALGARGPFNGGILRVLRGIIPPYRMVRQTAKIYTIMPSLLAVALVISGGAWLDRLRFRRVTGIVLALLLAFAGFEYMRRMTPIISLFEPEQGAYAAVAQDAADAGRAPHAAVIPLWPGDSHFTSIYQYFASIYRVRLLNGYRPTIREEYFNNVFERLVSMNQGWLTSEQLRHLRNMGVGYVMLHEDLFPEKVSPFPVAFTIAGLLRNPELELLEQCQSVWAFKILPEIKLEYDLAASDPYDAVGMFDDPETFVENAGPFDASIDLSSDVHPHWSFYQDWEVYGSTRRWEAERVRRGKARVQSADDASGGAYLELAAPGARVQFPSIWVAPSPELRWMVRARGYGILAVEMIAMQTGLLLDDLVISTDDWQWVSVPADVIEGYLPLSLKLEWDAGVVDVDMALLTAGRWDMPAPGESISIPAPCFFHAGYIDRDANAVVLRRDLDPQGTIFYGPKLPLPAGQYRVMLECESPAKPGTPVAQFNIRQRSADPVNWTPVFAGYPVAAEFELPVNLPFHLELLFKGTGDLVIRNVVFTRLYD